MLQECDVRTVLGVNTATSMSKLGRSSTAVVRGELRDAEQGVDICDSLDPPGVKCPDRWRTELDQPRVDEKGDIS